MKHSRRAVSIFGTLFNNITLKKTKSDGTVLSRTKGTNIIRAKTKVVRKNTVDPEDADLGMMVQRTAISMPRLAFELTGFEYDASRQQNKLIDVSLNPIRKVQIRVKERISVSIQHHII